MQPALTRLGWNADDVAEFIEAVAGAAGDEETHARSAAARYTARRLARDQTATGWRRLAQLAGADVVDRVRDWLGATNSEDCEDFEIAWEPPIPLTDLPRPPFPTDILPDWLRSYVEAVAVATQTPAALPGMLVLSALATACAKTVVVQITPDWHEPVNLFTATAMAPGERKSAVFTDVTRPIVEFEAAEAARLAPMIAQAESRQKILEQALAKAQKEAAQAAGSGQAPLLAKADELVGELAAMEVPAPIRLVVDDCSPERLASLLAQQGGRIAVMAPEGDIFDLMAGRYSANGTPNFGVYLRGHAGDALRVDRIGRRSEFVREPALTIGLAVQPEVIHGLANRPGFRGRGLLGRFLYALPMSLVGQRTIDPPAVADSIRRIYHHNLTVLLQMEPGAAPVESGQPEPRKLMLSPEAAAIFRRFRAELEPKLGDLGELGHISDWAGKLAGAVARIAGLLHMAAHVGRETPCTEPISDHTIAAATRLGMDLLIPHALSAFAQMGADPAVADARYVLRVLADRDLAEFSKRGLFQVVKGHFKTMEPLERALAILEEHGYVRPRPAMDRPGPGRRPSPTFDVNPLWRGERRGPGWDPTCENYRDDSEFGNPEPTAAQNAHNPQNSESADRSGDCEHSEDCERPPEHQEIVEWTATL